MRDKNFVSCYTNWFFISFYFLLFLSSFWFSIFFLQIFRMKIFPESNYVSKNSDSFFQNVFSPRFSWLFIAIIYFLCLIKLTCMKFWLFFSIFFIIFFLFFFTRPSGYSSALSALEGVVLGNLGIQGFQIINTIHDKTLTFDR